MGLTVGLDVGMQQEGFRAEKFDYWFSPQLVLRYTFQDWTFAVRMEHYKDKNAVSCSKG